MEDSTPKLMTATEFNASVKSWTTLVRGRAVRNLHSKANRTSKEWRKRKTPKLGNSLDGDFRDFNNLIVGIRFTFERHGVFLHYGVGRGYIKQGDSVVRGRKLSRAEKNYQRLRGYSRKDTENMKIAYDGSHSVRRQRVDWLDVEIRSGIKSLADIAQEFHGDKAMAKVLQTLDRITIDKKNNYGR